MPSPLAPASVAPYPPLFMREILPEPDSTPQSAAELLAEADRLYHAKSYDESLTLYHKAAASARAEFNRSVEAEATAQIARNHISLGKIEEGRTFLAEATKLASFTDPHAHSRLLSVRGRFEWKDGQRDIASQTFRDMLEYCQEQQLFGRASDAANMLGILSLELEEQIKWFTAGIRLLEHTDDHRLMGPLLNNLAATYYDAEKFDSALGYYLQAREMHWRFGNEREKIFSDLYVGMAYRSLGRGGDATRWLRPVLAWAERLEDDSLMGQASEELGLAAVILKDVDVARNYFQLAIAHYEQAGFRQHAPNLIADLEEKLKELDALPQ